MSKQTSKAKAPQSAKEQPKAAPAKPAPAKEPQAKVSLDPAYIGRITGTLLAICAATALLLGIVNYITSPIITAAGEAKNAAAMAQVLQADEYVPWEGTLPEHVTALYTARSGGADAGWVVQTVTNGSQGPITMVTGVDTDGAVTGVSVIKHSETPNIGTKVVADQSVLDRFIGMSHESGEITVNTGANRFDAISGATYSSRGVAAGVNAALDAAAWVLLEANYQPDAG